MYFQLQLLDDAYLGAHYRCRTIHVVDEVTLCAVGTLVCSVHGVRCYLKSPNSRYCLREAALRVQSSMMLLLLATTKWIGPFSLGARLRSLFSRVSRDSSPISLSSFFFLSHGQCIVQSRCTSDWKQRFGHETSCSLRGHPTIDKHIFIVQLLWIRRVQASRDRYFLGVLISSFLLKMIFLTDIMPEVIIIVLWLIYNNNNLFPGKTLEELDVC